MFARILALKGLFLVALLALALSLLASSPSSYGEGSSALQVTFIDVGQGDSIWLHASDGTDILVDGGPPSAGPTVVAYLQNTGIDDIEVIVLSHADADHSGGLIDVLQSTIPVGAIVHNGQSSATTTYQTLLAEMQNRGLTPTPAAIGQTYTWGPLTASVLNPQSAPTGNQNEDSVALLISYGNKKFLFTGDIGSTTEGTIVASGTPIAADVLKVAHHGSRYSSSASFLSAVAAPLAVIQVGAGNSYGHPAQETLDRLTAAGAAVRRTDLEGPIVLTFGGQPAEASPTATVAPVLVFLPVVMKNWPPTPTPTPTATPTWTPIPTSTPIPTWTPIPTNTPIPTSTPLPTSTPFVPSDLRITALVYEGSDEYVQITNYGSAQNMTGWRIHSVVGDQWYSFASGYAFGAGATVRAHSGPSALNSPPAELKWTTAYIWNNAGDKAILYNASNLPVDSSCYLAGCP